MNYQNDKQATRRRALSLLFISCALIAAAMSSPLYSARSGAGSSPQNEDDETRRLWNKQFGEAREKARPNRPNAQAQTWKSKPPGAAGPEAIPGAARGDELGDQLIGVTIWRLRPARPGDDRILVQKDGQYALERVAADTPFKEGELVRISVEAPREYDNYLYVIDREVYKDGRGELLGEPSLIFPGRGTPSGGNMISAGRSVYVPAQGDPIPRFTLQRSGENHVGERLFILISPEPMPVNVERPELDSATVAQWERVCGGQTESRESRGDMGKQWTKAEQEADQGARKLAQIDPLPQTIYRVRAKRGGCAMVAVPLRIAP